MVCWYSREEGQRDANVCQSEIRRAKFPKQCRIRRSAEYRQIAEKGNRRRTDHFQIRMLTNPLGLRRLGIAAGKKIGNACTRNWIKRRIREYFRLNQDNMPPGMDIVFIPLRGTTELSTKQIYDELDRFFKEYRPPAGLQPGE